MIKIVTIGSLRKFMKDHSTLSSSLTELNPTVISMYGFKFVPTDDYTMGEKSKAIEGMYRKVIILDEEKFVEYLLKYS
jgi:hypothetical protein